MEKEAEEKLIEEIDKYSRDDEVIALYSAYTKEELERNTLLIEAKEDGLKQGISQGIIKGGKEKSLEIAKKMLEENLDINLISKITGLPIENIVALAKE